MNKRNKYFILYTYAKGAQRTYPNVPRACTLYCTCSSYLGKIVQWPIVNNDQMAKKRMNGHNGGIVGCVCIQAGNIPLLFRNGNTKSMEKVDLIWILWRKARSLILYYKLVLKCMIIKVVMP